MCTIILLFFPPQCLIEGENTWRDLMKTALENLIVVLKDENTISPYEMCSSGLVQALFTVLSNVSHTHATTLLFVVNMSAFIPNTHYSFVCLTECGSRHET